MAGREPMATEGEELVRFVRMVSHGLRNPLAIAAGMLDLLDQLVGADLDDESRELVVRSSAAVHRTADMVLSVQRYVRAQHQPLQTGSVDLGEVATELAAALDPAEVAVDVAGALPTVTADRDLVEWVFHELYDNARCHAGAGRTTAVAVDVRQEGERWLVSVTDDGEGIPADRREAAFREGERLDRAGGGLGLGLPIVQAVLTRHGGDAWLEEAPGGGLRAVTAWPA